LVSLSKRAFVQLIWTAQRHAAPLQSVPMVKSMIVQRGSYKRGSYN